MEKKFGIFVGRFSPMHLGHEAVIRSMIEACGIDNCLVFIGSSNTKMSYRHLFSYEDRRGFIKAVFPDLQIAPLPDHPTDEEWLLVLDDIISLKNIDPKQVIFFGGCEEDVYFFVEAGRRHQLINRFDGSTPKISATEVRDALIEKRPFDKLLNPLIVNAVKECFDLRWESFKKF